MGKEIKGSRLSFLTLPIEIREIIYHFLFDPLTTLIIECAPRVVTESGSVSASDSTTWSANFESWAINPHPHSSQILRVCSQSRDEAISSLYSLRVFNLTARDSLKLLLKNIGPATFSHIRRITLEWDVLEELGRSLNKEDYRRGMSGLISIETAKWSVRHTSGTSMQFRNVKSSERSRCQAAYDITTKHPSLKVVAEQYFRSKSSSATTPTAQAMLSSRKVKWRFISSHTDLRDDEIALDIEHDLELLKATPDEALAGGFAMPMIDPF